MMWKSILKQKGGKRLFLSEEAEENIKREIQDTEFELEHGGYSDWFLPSIKQLTDYISQGNSVSISNIIDCDNEVCTWEFWTISGTSNSAAITYSMIPTENTTDHYLVGFGEGWSYNSYKKCFCVR